MSISKPVFKRAIIGIGIVLVVNLFWALLVAVGESADVEALFHDNLMQQAANHAVAGEILIAAIDDKSLQAYGNLPWDRARFAQLLNRLKAAGARAVAFDVTFLEPSPSDQQLADAIRAAMRPNDGSPPMGVALAVAAQDKGTPVPGKGMEYHALRQPPRALLESGAIIANVNVEMQERVLRHVPLVTFTTDRAYVTLPLAAAALFAGKPDLLNSLQLGPEQLRFGDYTIATDPAYRMRVNYFSKPGGYRSRSVADIADGKVNPQDLKGKLVLVGAFNATGLADDFPVPTSPDAKMDGVEVWANATQSLVYGKFVTAQGKASTIGIMLALSLVLAAAFLRWGAWAWIGTAVAVFGYSQVTYQIAKLTLTSTPQPGVQQLVVLPNAFSINACVIMASGALFVYLFVIEQRRRGAIYRMFGRYVTPQVAQQLSKMEAAGQLNLGGTRREATIMFGDIRGFTSLSEGAEPEEVMAMLNRYFDNMVRIIIQEGGTINKFIGDNVMVMFNVPMDLPNHALAACRAAHAVQEWIKNYRATHPEERAAFGFGINTGELVAGNMGSQDRMEYTVIGDTVNVAARLTGVAERDEVIISQAVLDQLDGSGARVIDKGAVKVKNRLEPVHVYAVEGFGEPGPVTIIGVAQLPDLVYH